MTQNYDVLVIELVPVLLEILYCGIYGKDHGDPERDTAEIRRPALVQIIIEQESTANLRADLVFPTVSAGMTILHWRLWRGAR
jgi:hypothetical protein